MVATGITGSRSWPQESRQFCHFRDCVAHSHPQANKMEVVNHLRL